MTADGDPVEPPVPLVGSIEAPAPSTFSSCLYAWLRVSGSRGSGLGGRSLLLLLAFAAIAAVVAPHLLVVVGAAVAVIGAWVVASIGLAWRNGLASSGAVIRPGGVESVFPTYRHWIPATSVVRSSLVPPYLGIRTAGSVILLDAGGLPPGSDQVVASLLAQPPPDPRQRLQGVEVASWTVTADVAARNQRSSFWSPAERWLRRARLVLAAFASVAAMILAGWWATSISRRGWSAAVSVSAADLRGVVITTTALTAALVLFAVGQHRNRLARSADGSPRQLVAGEAGCSVIAGETAASIPWGAVASVRIDEGWVVVRTSAPIAGFAIPSAAFLPGAIDQLVASVPAAARP